MDYRNIDDFRTTEAQVTTAKITQQATVQLPKVANLSNFKVTVNQGGSIGGVTVSWKLVNGIQGMAGVRLCRHFTNGFSGSQILHDWTLTTTDVGKTFSFVDTDPVLAEFANYYWLQIIPTAAVAASPYAKTANAQAQFLSGPQILPQLGAAQLPPLQIPTFAVSVGTGSGGLQRVYVNFQPPADPNFSYARVITAGYDGDPNTVFLAQSATSPFSFELIQTGETIPIVLVPVSLTGLANFVGAGGAGITLNGVATGAATVESVTAIKVGGGTNGIQVSWPASIDNVTGYTVFRSAPGAGSGAASSIATPSPATGTVIYLDTTAVNQNFDYYVKATNAAGTSGFSGVASSSGVADKRGNVTYSTTGNFAYTATTTTITWTWTSLQILRSDNTTTNITNGSQTITGAVASTTYTFFPYWDEIAGALAWVDGSANGSTPTFGFTAPTMVQLQKQQLLSHISLASGGMSATTTASGSGGGTGGGGGGGGGCFVNTRIKTINGFVRVEELPEFFYLENETGMHGAELVAHEDYRETMIDMGDGQLVTMTHQLRASDGTWKPALQVIPNPKTVWFEGTVYDIHVITDDEADRHYILENGYTAHNFLPK